MNMIAHATDAIRLTVTLTHCAGKKRVGLFTKIRFKPWVPIFCAEDQMQKYMG